jgi:hypothetical protein
MRRVVSEWQTVSLNDPPQSLRRRSVAATVAVSLILFATAACVLLADRPKLFVLFQESHASHDEKEFLAPLMSSINSDERRVLSLDMNKIFSKKNIRAADEAAAADLEKNPEYQALIRKTQESTLAFQQAAAVSRRSGIRRMAILSANSKKRHAALKQINEAVQAEKAAEAKLIQFARTKGFVVPPPSNAHSSLLKIFDDISKLDSAPAASANSLSTAGVVDSASITSSNIIRATLPPKVRAESHNTVRLSDALHHNAEHVASGALKDVDAEISMPAISNGSPFLFHGVDASDAAAAAQAEVDQAQIVLDSLHNVDNN